MFNFMKKLMGVKAEGKKLASRTLQAPKRNGMNVSGYRASDHQGSCSDNLNDLTNPISPINQLLAMSALSDNRRDEHRYLDPKGEPELSNSGQSHHDNGHQSHQSHYSSGISGGSDSGSSSSYSDYSSNDTSSSSYSSSSGPDF